MELQYMAANGILKSSWFDKNEKNLNLLEQQIYRLNSNVFILDNIFKFPFEFVFSDYPIFWGLTVGSLFETTILTIWKVVADGDIEKGYTTIQKVKRDVAKNLCDINYRKRFKEICVNSDFDKVASDLRKRVTKFRDNCAENFNFKLKGSISDLDIKCKSKLFLDIKEFKEEVNILYRVLCFDKPKKMIPSEYDISSDLKKQPDIIQLLDDIMIKSVWLNQPERNADSWSAFRKQKSQRELVILNRYRAKFGLSIV